MNQQTPPNPVPPGEFVNADPPTGGVVPATVPLYPNPQIPATTLTPPPVAPGDTAGVPAPATPTAAQAPVSMGTLGQFGQNILSEAKGAIANAQTAIKTAIDNALDKAVVEIPVIVDDATAAAASAILEAETNPTVAGWVKSLLGIASPVTNALDKQIDAKLVAGVLWLRSKL